MDSGRAARLLLAAARNVGTLRSLGDLPGHEFHGNQWTTSAFTRNDTNTGYTYDAPIRDYVSIKHEESGGEVAAWKRGDTLVLDHVSVPESEQKKGIGSALVNKMREQAANEGKTLETSGRATEEGKNLFEGFVRRGEAERIREQVKQSRKGINRSLPKRFKTYYRFKALRVAAQHRETLVHAAADAHVAKLSVAFRHAFAMGRKALGTPPNADRAARAIVAALRTTLQPTLTKALAAGGEAGLAMLSKQLRAAEDFRALKPPIRKLNIRFDAQNARAAAWALEHAGWLIDNIAQTTRERIQEAVARAQISGDLQAQYDDILAAVGDEDRAQLIARTESMTAANEGQRQGWDQAVDAGLLPADARRVWIATDVGPCPICEALDGNEAMLGEEYDGEDGGYGPPAHPNCRCTEGLSL